MSTLEMFRHFGNITILNLDLMIALGIVSLKVVVTRYVASPSKKLQVPFQSAL